MVVTHCYIPLVAEEQEILEGSHLDAQPFRGALLPPLRLAALSFPLDSLLLSSSSPSPPFPHLFFFSTLQAINDE